MPADVVEGRLEIVGVRPPRASRSARPREVVLGGFEVDVLESEVPKAEFLGHGSGPERQMIAVADVHRCARELLARCGATDLGARFDEQRRQAPTSEVGSGDETVVAGTDHDGVEVGWSRR